MRGHMAISLFALVFGALETGGAVQELVYRGFLEQRNRADDHRRPGNGYRSRPVVGRGGLAHTLASG